MTRELLELDGLVGAEVASAKRQRRGEVDRLVDLACHLPARERDVIRFIYERGFSAAELARVTGGPVRSVQRRVLMLRRRMTSPMFEFVAGHCEDLPPLRKGVAQSVVLRGRSMRSTSRLLGVSLYQVRRELERIRAAAEARREATVGGGRGNVVTDQ